MQKSSLNSSCILSRSAAELRYRLCIGAKSKAGEASREVAAEVAAKSIGMDEDVACYNHVVISIAMADDADTTRNERLQVYLKLLDYKRSIGATQWTVLSVFTTASGAVLVFGLGRDSSLIAAISVPIAVGLYWFGFMLYRRYRAYNHRVSEYLVELEVPIGVGFQKHVNSFQEKGFSTEKILALGGVVYSLFGFAVLVVSLLTTARAKH